MLYGLQVNNRGLEFLTCMMNIAFYSSEVKFILCKKLCLIQGEFGPVEAEALLASIVGMFGYFGPEYFQQTVSQAFGFEGIPLVSETRLAMFIVFALMPM